MAGQSADLHDGFLVCSDRLKTYIYDIGCDDLPRAAAEMGAGALVLDKSLVPENMGANTAAKGQPVDLQKCQYSCIHILYGLWDPVTQSKASNRLTEGTRIACISLVSIYCIMCPAVLIMKMSREISRFLTTLGLHLGVWQRSYGRFAVGEYTVASAPGSIKAKS